VQRSAWTHQISTRLPNSRKKRESVNDRAAPGFNRVPESMRLKTQASATPGTAPTDRQDQSVQHPHSKLVAPSKRNL
jgi:hypothetical protein